LLPPGLASERPGLASLLRDALGRLGDSELERIGRELGDRPPLADLWTASGGHELYGYAVAPFDLDALNGHESLPVLGDDCLPFVRLGRKGRRPLLLGLVGYAAGRQFVANATARESTRHQGLVYTPPRDGVFRAARY